MEHPLLPTHPKGMNTHMSESSYEFYCTTDPTKEFKWTIVWATMPLSTSKADVSQLSPYKPFCPNCQHKSMQLFCWNATATSESNSIGKRLISLGLLRCIKYVCLPNIQTHTIIIMHLNCTCHRPFHSPLGLLLHTFTAVAGGTRTMDKSHH